jgi:hypothetical protein
MEGREGWREGRKEGRNLLNQQHNFPRKEIET